VPVPYPYTKTALIWLLSILLQPQIQLMEIQLVFRHFTCSHSHWLEFYWCEGTSNWLVHGSADRKNLSIYSLSWWEKLEDSSYTHCIIIPIHREHWREFSPAAVIVAHPLTRRGRARFSLQIFILFKSVWSFERKDLSTPSHPHQINHKTRSLGKECVTSILYLTRKEEILLALFILLCFILSCSFLLCFSS
jgi:hypothetical protein